MVVISVIVLNIFAKNIAKVLTYSCILHLPHDKQSVLSANN